MQGLGLVQQQFIAQPRHRPTATGHRTTLNSSRLRLCAAFCPANPDPCALASSPGAQRRPDRLAQRCPAHPCRAGSHAGISSASLLWGPWAGAAWLAVSALSCCWVAGGPGWAIAASRASGVGRRPRRPGRGPENVWGRRRPALGLALLTTAGPAHRLPLLVLGSAPVFASQAGLTPLRQRDRQAGWETHPPVFDHQLAGGFRLAPGGQSAWREPWPAWWAWCHGPAALGPWACSLLGGRWAGEPLVACWRP